MNTISPGEVSDPDRLNGWVRIALSGFALASMPAVFYFIVFWGDTRAPMIVRLGGPGLGGVASSLLIIAWALVLRFVCRVRGVRPNPIFRSFLVFGLLELPASLLALACLLPGLQFLSSESGSGVNPVEQTRIISEQLRRWPGGWIVYCLWTPYYLVFAGGLVKISRGIRNTW